MPANKKRAQQTNPKAATTVKANPVQEKLARPAKSKKPTPKSKSKTVRKSAIKRRPQPKTPAKKTTKPRNRATLKPNDVAEVFATFAKIDPDPKGELESVNDFTFLVAVVLSAQATDVGVNKATKPLFKIADTPEKMFKRGEEKLRDDIKTIGLFRNKAKNVIALSRKLIDEFGSKVPRDRDALETLPGVGRKTANVVMNVAFGEPTMAVDTHVLRVSNRIGLSNGSNPLAVEKDLKARIPEEYGIPAHHWLILHGRYLCKARKPECWRCPIINLCRYDEKTNQN